jgi:hypothetical protein
MRLKLCLVNFLWPQHLKIDTTPLVRLGRVLHWLFTGVAGLMLTLPFLWPSTSGDGVAQYGDGFLIAIGFAIPMALLGRGLRYVLSGE